MTTAQQIVDRARRALLGPTREQMNRLATTINASDEPLTFSYDLAGIQPNAEVEVDLELIRVWSVNAGAKQATDVERGFAGTAAASHNGGTMVRVNPRWTSLYLLEMLQAQVNALSGYGLHRFRTTPVTTYDWANQGWDVSAVTDMVEPYTVDGRPDTWSFYDRANAILQGEWRRQPVTLTYMARITPPAALTDDITTAGVLPTWEDILVYGMQIMAASARETARNDYIAQGEPRRADEVPAGALAASVRNLILLQRNRIGDEVRALRSKYPRFARRSSGEAIPLND